MTALDLAATPRAPGPGRGPRVVSVRIAAVPDTAAWAQAHAAGRVPDRSPYGLHRLGEAGDLVLAADAAPAPGGPVARRLDDLLRHRGAGWDWWSRTRWPVPAGTDLVACWDERTGVPALTGPRRVGVATGVIWLAETRAPAPWAAVARRALRRAAAVWVLSGAQLGPLREDWGVPASRLHHLPFGIDEQFWSPAVERSAAGTDGTRVEGPPVVLGVGNDRHRDHVRLVDAVAGSAARLTLVTALPVDVAEAVGERIPVLDHVALRARYATAAVVAVLLHPNRHVSGVTTLLEAQAMGRPVVVSDTPGIRDYLEPGVTADLVPVGDTAAARDAISRLLADPARAAAMGTAGREFVRRRARSADTATALAGILRAA